MKKTNKDLYDKIGFGVTAATGPITLDQRKKNQHALMNDKKSAELIELAYNHGVRFFATDSVEEIDDSKVFGYTLARYRKNVKFCINIGIKSDGSSDFSREYFFRQLKKALDNLQTDYIDYVHINKIPVDILKKGKFITDIENFKRNGVIKSFGVSSICADHAEQITALSICDSIQVMYNLANREIENKNLHKKYVIVKSPLWSGMLSSRAMLSSNYPPLDRRATYLTHEELVKRRKTIKLILDAVKWPVNRLTELSIRYLISNNKIDTILFGFNRHQFLNILEIFDKGSLDEKELEIIRKIGSEYSKRVK